MTDHTELSRLISRLERGISKNSSYVQTIRHPRLLVSSLKELRDLTGNDKVKDAVATQISHLIMIKRRALEDDSVREDNVMLNTVLYGPPGVGKTLVGTKLAKIWYSLGFLERRQQSRAMFKDMVKDMLKDKGVPSESDMTLYLYIGFIFLIVLTTIISTSWSVYQKVGGWVFVGCLALLFAFIGLVVYYALREEEPVPSSTSDTTETIIDTLPDVENVRDDQIIKVVTRADFVDKYVGWSDKKTIKLLEENLGKVLFVDEAYSLVTDVHDSFGIEVLTTINLFLSQHSNEIIVVFAGYKDLMETGIFSIQPGLRRRFMWQFDCNGYNSSEIFEIFKMQLGKKGWSLLDEAEVKELFSKNGDAFPAFGGDTERLAFFSELEHSREFIGNDNLAINKISYRHVKRGLSKLRENNIQDPETSHNSTNPLANIMEMMKREVKTR